MPPANEAIMLGTLIQLFRHLKHQNPSTGDDFIYISGIIFLVPFLATKEAVPPLTNDPILWGRSIQLFRHLKNQNLSIMSDSIGRAKMAKQFNSWMLELFDTIVTLMFCCNKLQLNC